MNIMRALIGVLALSVICLSYPAPAAAQEGHPLKGSWIGKWEQNKALGEDVIIILNWDGKAITGMINPGTDNIAIKNATLNPDTWVVHLEGDAKDKAGSVTYVLEGKIENLALPNRSITGTWKAGSQGGRLTISRQ
jgi:hypothetical protein